MPQTCPGLWLCFAMIRLALLSQVNGLHPLTGLLHGSKTGSASPDLVFAYHPIWWGKKRFFCSHPTKPLHLLYLDQTGPPSGPGEGHTLNGLGLWANLCSKRDGTMLIGAPLGLGAGWILPKSHNKYRMGWGSDSSKRKRGSVNNGKGKEWMLGKKPTCPWMEGEEQGTKDTPRFLALIAVDIDTLNKD